MRWQRHRVDMQRARAELRQLIESHAGGVAVSSDAVTAAAQLGPVTEADLIDADDPRANV
jgi:hypothetical protein